MAGPNGIDPDIPDWLDADYVGTALATGLVEGEICLVAGNGTFLLSALDARLLAFSVNFPTPKGGGFPAER